MRQAERPQAPKRYPIDETVFSDLDVFEDLLTFLVSLTSREYVHGILTRYHALSSGDSKLRAKIIVPHVRTAIEFIRESQSTNPELCFLNVYYGILNLLKVYILCSKYHAELRDQRHHGAAYQNTSNYRMDLLHDSLCIKKKGTIPLFYKVITNTQLTQKETVVRLRDFYPLVSGVDAEYTLVTGTKAMNRFASVSIHLPQEDGETEPRAMFVRAGGYGRAIPKKQLPLIVNFKNRRAPNVYSLGRLKDVEGSTWNSPESHPAVRKALACHLIYFPRRPDVMLTPICTTQVEYFEELPIVFLFFHMSNVVRYHPEYLEFIRQSRYWPILAAARRHSLKMFLTLFWSYMHQKNLILQNLAAM